MCDDVTCVPAGVYTRLCVPNVYRMCTECVPNVYRMCTECVRQISKDEAIVYLTCTECVLNVYWQISKDEESDSSDDELECVPRVYLVCT